MVQTNVGFVHRTWRRVEGEGGGGGGSLEWERTDKENLRQSFKQEMFRKRVCLNSWRPCVPWLECGNSAGVSHVTPSGSSSVVSYGNARATRWQSHPTPTSAGETRGNIFLLCSISRWLGSCWQHLTSHLALCISGQEQLTSFGWGEGSLPLRGGHFW